MNDRAEQEAARPTGITTLVRILIIAAGCVMAVQAAMAIGGIGGVAGPPTLNEWGIAGVLTLASLFCVARAVLSEQPTAARIAWALAGVGFAASVASALSSEASSPASLPSGLGVVLFPAMTAAVVLLAVEHLRGLSARLALNAAVVMFAVGALAGALVSEQLSAAAPPGLDAALIHFGYPLGAVALTAAVFAIGVLSDWHPGSRLSLVLGAAFAIGVSSAVAIARGSPGPWQSDPELESVIGGAALVITWVAWMPAAQPERVSADRTPAGLSASAFALVSLAVIVLATITGDVPVAATVAAAASLAALIAAYGLTLARLFELQRKMRQWTLFDPSTGLGNRRKLIDDLKAATRELPHRGPLVLILIDLIGFRGYNEDFGGLAGDALITRLGRHLSAGLRGSGEAYRIGGDEFAVLARVGRSGADPIITATMAALSARGESFEIDPIAAGLRLPDEATGADEAIRLAERRLRERRLLEPADERRMQTSIVDEIRSREEQRESTPLLPGELGRDVATRLALDDRGVADVAAAACLYDIGKLAWPDDLASHPGTLDREDWPLTRLHTIVAAHVLSVPLDRSSVARLLHRCREHYDGTGYPDRLRGEEIPVGARIVAVCSAFDAMTSDRPHRGAVSVGAALGELRECAGHQFDPQVVEVFSEVVGEHRAQVPEEAVAR